MNRLTSLNILICCSISILTWTKHLDGAPQADLHHGVMLDSASFRIESRLALIASHSNVYDEDIRFNEMYSNEQKRAKIERITGINLGGSLHFAQHAEFYFESSSKIDDSSKLVQVTHNKTNNQAVCKSIDKAQLAQEMLGSSSNFIPEIHNGANWLYNDASLPEHVIGPARLLLLVKANMDKMQEVGGINSSIDIRNHPIKKYELQLNIDYGNDGIQANLAGKPTKMTLYFGRSSVHWPNAEFPLQIWVIFPSEAEMVVDYSMLEPIYWNDFMEDDEAVDMFAFPLGISCSSQLPKLAGLSSTSLKSQRVVSFKADFYENILINESWYLYSPFIAYDGYSRAMRFEYTETRSSKSSRSALERINVVTIHDLKRNFKYNIEQQVGLEDYKSDADFPLNRSLDLGQSETTSSSDSLGCISARIIEAERKINPFEPLIPFSKLSHMGSGRVRGLDVLIFEHESDTLPAMLFPLVNYNTTKGEIKSGFKPASKSPANNRQYSIIYYLAKTSENEDSQLTEEIVSDKLTLGPLIRVDVLNRQSLEQRVDVHEFMWQLAQAPSGDRADKLFELQTKCMPEDDRQERSAELKMELEFSLKETESIALLRNYSAQLWDNLPRSKALIRAIAGASSKIFPSQLFELESRLKLMTEKRKFSIQLEAKLSDSQPGVYKAISVGFGLIRSEAVKRLRARTFEACFWAAIRRQIKRKSKLLFSYCGSQCIVDDSPEESAEQAGKFQSSAFVMRDDMPCEILKLVKFPQTVSSFKIWTESYESLRNKDLYIPLVRSGYDDQPAINMTIKEIRIHSDYWIKAGEEAQSKIESRVLAFPGVGLVEDSNSVTKRIEPRVFPTQMDLDPKERVMNFATCHSRCVSDINCRSFSLCISGQQVECMNSQADLRNSNLIGTQIENARKTGTKEVKFQIDDPQVGQNDTEEAQKFSLKLDRKCQVYNKRAIEMFQTGSWRSTRVSSDVLKAVENEEECAELCLRRSVKFFKRLASKKLTYLKKLTSDDKKDESVKSLHDEYLDSMKFFCSRFRYYPLATGSMPDFETIDKMRKRGLDKATGLCSMGRPPVNEKSGGGDNSTPAKDSSVPSKSNQTDTLLLKMKTFDILYSMFYQREFNVQILPTSATTTIANVGQQELINNCEVETSRDLTVELCARKCFLQTSGVEPSCKSFTLIENRGELMQSGKIRYHCIYNSITLAEARRSDHPETLISEQPLDSGDQDVLYWHYDPMDNYSLESGIWSKFYQENSSTNNSFLFGGFSVFFITIASIASGIVLGILLAGKVIGKFGTSRRDSIADQSRSILNNIVVNGEEQTNNSSIELDANIGEL